MSGGPILVVNAGSTSVKLHLVDERERSEPVSEIESVKSGRVEAVAHRVVQGGPRFSDPVPIDARVLEQIFDLEALAPLHNAPALRGIERAKAALPGVPQVAVFDSAFHHSMPSHARAYALPRRWREDWGVRRYGFHGLSLEWSCERSAQMLGRPVAELSLVVCHLGGGCSVSAIAGGRSLDTTMGFSPLEGVPMVSRSGSVDPGALIYLTRERGLSPAQIEHALNFDSGLRGLAGGDGDMAQIERAARRGEPEAQLALDVFCHRLAAAVGAMAVTAGAVAGRIDALVFTAGIGENSPLVREEVCRRLALLGVRVDRQRNDQGKPDCDLSGADSAVRVLAIHAREEAIAARAARKVLGAGPPRGGARPAGPALKKDRPAGGSGPIGGRE